MRELAVQASSDIQTKTERKAIQDEVNQINSALNALASIQNLIIKNYLMEHTMQK